MTLQWRLQSQIIVLIEVSIHSIDVLNVQTTPQSLVLPDMISICFDICKGCEYLEDLHFVHRSD